MIEPWTDLNILRAAYFRKRVLAFPLLSWHWDDPVSFNPVSWKIRTYLSNDLIITPTGVLMTQGGKEVLIINFDLISEWSIEKFSEIWLNNHKMLYDKC